MTGDRQVIVIRSSTIDRFACARRGDFSINRELIQVDGKRQSLERGSLLHHMLECYYQLKLWADFHHDQMVVEAINYGRIMSASMTSLSSEDIEKYIKTFMDYTTYYQYETYRPVAVERSFAKQLYADDNLIIMVEGKIDAVMEEIRTSEWSVWDHKTTDKKYVPSLLYRGNQYITYAWAFDVPYILDNQIGVQKTKDIPDRFLRTRIDVPKPIIEEWLGWTVDLALKIHKYNTDQSFPPDFTKCREYGGCTYRRICEAVPQDRPDIISRYYRKLEEHEKISSSEESANV